MKIIDLSGKIQKGIWKYGEMYPDFSPRQIQAGENIYFCEVFDGFNSQTGTYLETVAHFNGYEGQPMIEDIPLEKLVQIPCHIVKLDIMLSKDDRTKIERIDFEKAMNGMNVNEGDAILFSCGYSDWYSDDFLTTCPYLSLDAMEFLLSKKPSILGSDLPSWEKDEGVFSVYSKTQTLMLAPLVNLEQANEFGLLTVLPLNITDTCCVPARAILMVN